MKIASWGRLNNDFHRVIPLDRIHLKNQIQSQLPGISHGMGRSYGDVCLNPYGTLWKTASMDRFIHFDAKTGRLKCEAGVLLKTIQQTFVSQGWMLPVTPGTQWVTLGGAIANDVHGKNHHLRGTFGHHIHQLKLLRTDGQIIECSPSDAQDWFKATIGGMGLTGVVAEAEIQLQRVPGPWLLTETLPYHHLKEFFDLADDSEKDWEYTVSWVDCLSKGNYRGLFMRANPIDCPTQVHPPSRSFTFPFTPPISLVNSYSLKLFNALYFYLNQRKKNQQIMHYEPFFYPLDHILEWNKMYGYKGFYQYQCVVSNDNREVIQALLDEISKAHEGSFLAVLKTFGPMESIGYMSFAKPGVTLALDFANRGERTLALFRRLDKIVEAAGGRLYCAKNAYMSAALFQSGYPAFERFKQYRDPGMSSGLSRRLMGF